MTNEERFIASCAIAGEGDVRQKLSAGRYSERRAAWASDWLEQAESGKSDATKAAERNSRTGASAAPNRYFQLALVAAVIGLLVATAIAFLSFS